MMLALLAFQADPRLERHTQSLASQQFGEAEAILEQLAAEQPREPAYRERLGLLLLRRGALAEARVHLDQAVGLQPEAPGPRLALARVLWLLNERPRAEALVAEAGRLRNQDARVHRAIAAFWRQAGDGKRAYHGDNEMHVTGVRMRGPPRSA
ncbi:MAG: tetratricopeptide repeat protein [Bryobacteraceae bacterium]